jgi:hypothetical protein
MAAQPTEPDPGPVTGSYDVIHLGDQSAVVVPMDDFLRLRALEEAAPVEVLEDAEDMAALRSWETREAAGATSYTPLSEVRRRLGLER